MTNLEAIQADSELGLFLDRQFQTGLGLWIDSAIPNPGAANRPEIYNNPHLRIALMYQGFISTFTAVHIPKMWQRFKNQGPAMTYNVFAQVATVAVMSYLAQALKDEVLYDDDDNPYSEGQKVYRAVKKTGLLGTPERVLDWFFPLFPDNTRGLEGAAKNILGELGPVGQAVYTVGKGTTQLAGGEETQQGLNNLAKLLPAFSISSPARHKLVTQLTGQPFGSTVNDEEQSYG